jgi:hypothetical protein
MEVTDRITNTLAYYGHSNLYPVLTFAGKTGTSPRRAPFVLVLGNYHCLQILDYVEIIVSVKHSSLLWPHLTFAIISNFDSGLIFACKIGTYTRMVGYYHCMQISD